MAGVIRLQNYVLKRLIPTLRGRHISTSKKNSDTASITADQKVERTVINNKNWVSYGFEVKSEAEDRRNTHSIFFASITLCMVGIAFILAYIPDYNLKDWAQREAFLELRRREEQGLPLVDSNLVDPSKITLPSDEELGDTEIII